MPVGSSRRCPRIDAVPLSLGNLPSAFDAVSKRWPPQPIAD